MADKKIYPNPPPVGQRKYAPKQSRLYRIWLTQQRRRERTALLDPLTLFANGEQGAWYDPSDLTTLFQDSAGTTPVTTDGDPVGLMLDKSGNDNHATQASSGLKLIYRTDGTLHWLECDGFDDFMNAPGNILTGTTAFMCVMGGYGAESTGAGWLAVEGSVGGADAIIATFEPGVRTGGGFVDFGLPVSSTPQVYRLNYLGAGNIFDIECTIDGVVRAINSGSDGAPNLGGTTTTELFGGAGVVSGLFYGGIFMDRDATPVEAVNVDNYMANKAGVTL